MIYSTWIEDVADLAVRNWIGKSVVLTHFFFFFFLWLSSELCQSDCLGTPWLALSRSRSWFEHDWGSKIKFHLSKSIHKLRSWFWAGPTWPNEAKPNHQPVWTTQTSSNKNETVNLCLTGFDWLDMGLTQAKSSQLVNRVEN